MKRNCVLPLEQKRIKRIPLHEMKLYWGPFQVKTKIHSSLTQCLYAWTDVHTHTHTHTRASAYMDILHTFFFFS